VRPGLGKIWMDYVIADFQLGFFWPGMDELFLRGCLQGDILQEGIDRIFRLFFHAAIYENRSNFSDI